MALNLWKLGGRQTSYNPLPVGYSGNNVMLGIGEFVVTFKAKTASNGSVSVQTEGAVDTNISIPLTTNLKMYSVNVVSKKQQNLWISANKGDIIIEDIQLIEKPLPKLTINGISDNPTDWQQGTSNEEWTLIGNATRIRLVNKISIKPNEKFCLTIPSSYAVFVRHFSKNQTWQLGYTDWLAGGGVYTPLLGADSIGVIIRKIGDLPIMPNEIEPIKPMLNLGSIPAPYEKKRGDRMVMPIAIGDGTYQLNSKPKTTVQKAQTGLRMDGVSNYLQLPSMTMDSIEIDCLIDSVQPNNPNAYLVDTRSGTSSGFFNQGGTSNNQYQLYVDDIFKSTNSLSQVTYNKRTKVKLIFPSPFTDDVTVGARFNGQFPFRGILYGVKCFLNGQVIASYGFTNPHNIVGDKILNGSAKNLIPSFEDRRWSLHANFKVLGKDLGRLDATGTTQQSHIAVDVEHGASYLVKCITGVDANYRVRVRETDGSGNILATLTTNSLNTYTFMVPQNVSVVNYSLLSAGIGSFDFVKPQLYKLDGKEGTLFGNPITLFKQAKRLLYNKR